MAVETGLAPSGSGQLGEWTLRCNEAVIKRLNSLSHTHSESKIKLSAAEAGVGGWGGGEGKLNCSLLGITMIL